MRIINVSVLQRGVKPKNPVNTPLNVYIIHICNVVSG